MAISNETVSNFTLSERVSIDASGDERLADFAFAPGDPVAAAIMFHDALIIPVKVRPVAIPIDVLDALLRRRRERHGAAQRSVT